MSILTLKPDALIVEEFSFAEISQFMGLNEDGATPMGYSGPNKSAYGGFFGMGYRLKGDNLNTSFLTAWDASDAPYGPKATAKAAAIATWWNRIHPWVFIQPASDNTCTNAAVRIFNLQCYTKSLSTGLWTRASNANQYLATIVQFDLGYTFTPTGTVTSVYTDNINIPAFAVCPNPADWSAESSTQSKYNALHGPVGKRITVDASDISGIFVTFESQLTSTDGNNFNAQPKILVQCGADAYINEDNLNSGTLLGAGYVPAIGAGRLSFANSDGTRRKHYFGTFLGTGTYQDLTSAYNVAGGVSVDTNVQFQANFPRRSYQATL